MDGQTRGAGASYWLLVPVPRGMMFVKTVDATLEVKDKILLTSIDDCLQSQSLGNASKLVMNRGQ